jgi:hypothetical protein
VAAEVAVGEVGPEGWGTAAPLRDSSWAQALMHQSGLCYNYNQHLGHGQMLRIVELASGRVGMYFLTVSCR